MKIGFQECNNEREREHLIQRVFEAHARPKHLESRFEAGLVLVYEFVSPYLKISNYHY